MLDKVLYNTVLCQTFSPCGKYLIAGNIYGQLAVFDLDNIFNPVIELLTSDYNKPKYIHLLESENQVCSLVSTENFLIVGSVNEIFGWNWKSVLHSKLGKPSWTIRIQPQSFVEKCDINSLWYSEEAGKLYAGCGDNKIYVYNLEDGRLVSTYEGHNDYVHCVDGNGNQVISAGEDGLVCLWDTRSNKSHNKIEPHTNSKVSRPDIGKWMGSAALGDDWIVCGGGPRLSLWHLRSLDAVTVFDIPDHGIHVSFFHDDCVFAGGAAKHLYQLSYSGDIRVELPVSATTVYSAALRTNPHRVLTIAGSSPEIDLCTTFNYRDQVIPFKKKWKGLRDTFVREIKKTKNAPSGSGASKIQYIYFQRLIFLERSVRNKKTESNIQDTFENAEAGNKESTADAADEDIMRPPNQNIKRKKMTAADAEFLNIIKNYLSSRNQQQPLVSSATEGDDDKLFCLSLHKELLKVPEANRIAVKIELMKILQAAQQSSQSTMYSNNSYFSNSSASFSTSVPVRYHAQPSRPNEFTYQEYDPETPPITPWQGRNSISVPRSSQATLYVNSPSTSSRDSQDSECLDLFQNDGVD